MLRQTTHSRETSRRAREKEMEGCGARGEEKETRLPLFEVRVAYLGAFVRLVDLFTRLLFFPIPPLFPPYIPPSPFCKVCVVHSFSQLTHRASDLCSYCPARGIVSPLFIVHLCVIFPPWLGSVRFYLFATRPRFLMFVGLKGICVLR